MPNGTYNVYFPIKAGDKKTHALEKNVCLVSLEFEKVVFDLFSIVWQQGHESSSFDCLSHGVLASCRATCLTPADDAAVTVNKLLQHIDVLVVYEHRTWTLAIH